MLFWFVGRNPIQVKFKHRYLYVFILLAIFVYVDFFFDFGGRVDPRTDVQRRILMFIIVALAAFIYAFTVKKLWIKILAIAGGTYFAIFATFDYYSYSSLEKAFQTGSRVIVSTAAPLWFDLIGLFALAISFAWAFYSLFYKKHIKGIIRNKVGRNILFAITAMVVLVLFGMVISGINDLLDGPKTIRGVIVDKKLAIVLAKSTSVRRYRLYLDTKGNTPSKRLTVSRNIYEASNLGNNVEVTYYPRSNHVVKIEFIER